MLKAGDIMEKEPVTVHPGMTVDELGRLFIEKKSSGFPVVDTSGALVGMVTENDLINRNKRLHIPTVLRLFDAFIPLEGYAALEEEIRKMSATVVSEIYTAEPITIKEDTTIEEIATIMAEKKVHHLPVLRDGALVGLVDQHNLIKGISGGESTVSGA